jgi:hypothetical protein
MRAFALASTVLSLAALGCTTTRGTTAAEPDPQHYVRDIRLSQTRGEVGREFAGDLTWDSNFLREPEFALTGLPPGLRFDDGERKVVGVPARPGFFQVQVAIRSRVEEKAPRRPTPEDRWWTEVVRIEIYDPIE